MSVCENAGCDFFFSCNKLKSYYSPLFASMSSQSLSAREWHVVVAHLKNGLLCCNNLQVPNFSKVAVSISVRVLKSTPRVESTYLGAFSWVYKSTYQGAFTVHSAANISVVASDQF